MFTNQAFPQGVAKRPVDPLSHNAATTENERANSANSAKDKAQRIKLVVVGGGSWMTKRRSSNH